MKRHCEVCNAPADPSRTSAHYVRVHWLCTTHGQAFHGLGHIDGSTAEVMARIDAWMESQRGNGAAL